MPFHSRSAASGYRRQKRERENAWRVCPTHGGYNPMQMTLGGRLIAGPCPKCAAARYEAAASDHRG